MEKQKRYSKNIKVLANKIKAVREPKEDDRLTAYEDMLAFLNYEEEFQIYEIDGLMIKAAEKAFPGTPNKVYIALICLGLMQGCYYGDMPKIEDRRHHLLLYINYLGRKERIPYAKADDDLKKDYRGRFRRNEEEKVFLQLAEYLICQNIKTFIEDIGNYIDEEQSLAILPEPGYLGKGYLERQSQKEMPEPSITTNVNTDELNETAIKSLLDELCEPGQGRLFEDVASDIWKELGLDGDFDLAKFEALLIRIIVEPYEDGEDEELEHDIGLLTFGLLHQYHHSVAKTVQERYRQYLNHSVYIKRKYKSNREFHRYPHQKQEEIIQRLNYIGDRCKEKVCKKISELVKDGDLGSFMQEAVLDYTSRQPEDGARFESKLPEPRYILKNDSKLEKIIRLLPDGGALIISVSLGVCIMLVFLYRGSIVSKDSTSQMSAHNKLITDTLNRENDERLMMAGSNSDDAEGESEESEGSNDNNEKVEVPVG